MGCVGKLGSSCKEKLGNDIQNKYGRDGKRFEVVSKRAKGVWRDCTLVPNEWRLENRKNKMNLRMGGC